MFFLIPLQTRVGNAIVITRDMNKTYRSPSICTVSNIIHIVLEVRMEFRDKATLPFICTSLSRIDAYPQQKENGFVGIIRILPGFH